MDIKSIALCDACYADEIQVIEVPTNLTGIMKRKDCNVNQTNDNDSMCDIEIYEVLSDVKPEGGVAFTIKSEFDKPVKPAICKGFVKTENEVFMQGGSSSETFNPEPATFGLLGKNLQNEEFTFMNIARNAPALENVREDEIADGSTIIINAPLNIDNIKECQLVYGVTDEQIASLYSPVNNVIDLSSDDMDNEIYVCPAPVVQQNVSSEEVNSGEEMVEAYQIAGGSYDGIYIAEERNEDREEGQGSAEPGNGQVQQVEIKQDIEEQQEAYSAQGSTWEGDVQLGPEVYISDGNVVDDLTDGINALEYLKICEGSVNDENIPPAKVKTPKSKEKRIAEDLRARWERSMPGPSGMQRAPASEASRRKRGVRGGEPTDSSTKRRKAEKYDRFQRPERPDKHGRSERGEKSDIPEKNRRMDLNYYPESRPTTSRASTSGTGNSSSYKYGPSTSGKSSASTSSGQGPSTSSGHGSGTSSGYGPSTSKGYGGGTSCAPGPSTSRGYGGGGSGQGPSTSSGYGPSTSSGYGPSTSKGYGGGRGQGGGSGRSCGGGSSGGQGGSGSGGSGGSSSRSYGGGSSGQGPSTSKGQGGSTSRGQGGSSGKSCGGGGSSGQGGSGSSGSSGGTSRSYGGGSSGQGGSSSGYGGSTSRSYGGGSSGQGGGTGSGYSGYNTRSQSNNAQGGGTGSGCSGYNTRSQSSNAQGRGTGSGTIVGSSSGASTSGARDYRRSGKKSSTQALEETMEKLSPRDISLPFLQSLRGSIKKLTKDDLEELVVQKLCEVITERSTVGQLRKKAELLERDQERWKERVLVLTRQMKEMDMVMKRYMCEVRRQTKNKNFPMVSPLRVTRSVGLQVSFTSSFSGPCRMVSHSQPSTSSGACPVIEKVIKYPGQRARSISPTPGPSTRPGSPLQTDKETPVIDLTEEDDEDDYDDFDDDYDSPAGDVSPKHVYQPPTVPVRPPSQIRVANPPHTAQTNNGNRVAYLLPTATTSASGSAGPSQTRQVLIATPTGQQPQKNALPSVPPLLYKGSAILQPGTQHPTIISQGGRTLIARPPKHPAPLPVSPLNQVPKTHMKQPPPKPTLKISKVPSGIVLSWNMTLGPEHEEIESYQLYAYQESATPPSSSLWKRVGDVKALPLPMACTLTQFVSGHKYYFAVRAVDIHSRTGPYSIPGSIVLVK